VAEAEAIEKAPLRRDDRSQQIDKEMLPSAPNSMKGRGRKVEIRLRKTSHQREQDGRAHAKVSQEARIAQMLPGVAQNLPHVFGAHKILRQRKHARTQNAP